MIASNGWKVIATREYAHWYQALSTQEQDAVIDALLHLKAEGPSLRRPLSGQIASSGHGNMKELIPPRANIRILYAFDPHRHPSGRWRQDRQLGWLVQDQRRHRRRR